MLNGRNQALTKACGPARQYLLPRHLSPLHNNNKFKENLEILSSIKDHRKKSRETREVAYTCRYISGHLIPIHKTKTGLGIKCPLVYLQA